MTKITELADASVPLDPTDLVEVVQQVGSTPVNKKVPVAELGGGGGGSTLPLDIAPASAHAKDDEFDAATLDPKWTKGFKSWTETLEQSWLTMTPGGAAYAHFMRQTAPTGAFTISAKVSSPLGYTLSDTRPGIFVARTADSKALVWGLGFSGGPHKAMWIEHSNYSESVDWGAYNGAWSNNIGGHLSNAEMWYRMAWDPGTGVITMSFSQNGVRWYTAATRGGWSQPDRIGVCIENNSGNTNVGDMLCVDWFRVTE